MFVDVFNTPDGLAHFVPAEGCGPAELPDGDYPFALTTGRVIFHFHTASMTGRTDKLVGELSEGFVEINTDDARRLGLRHGDLSAVASRRGEIELRVRVGDDVPPGMAFVPFHFNGSQANRLTTSAFDPACRMPAFKLCAVALRKVGDGR
jgi:formate dehydrogenase major subunit